MGIHGMKNNEFKTICVFMQKGGVGKTTLTTMISYELAKYGKVLVVDADQQGNFTYLYDPEGEKVSSTKCFLSVLKEETSLKDGLISLVCICLEQRRMIMTLDLIWKVVLGMIPRQ